MSWLAVAALLACGAGVQDRSGRDVPPTPVGTATVSGVVTTATDRPVPLRRARVTLLSREVNFNRTIVTDETGRFAFQRVPAAKYTLSATKEAFLEIAFGARRPGATGTPLVVADGAQVEGVILRVPRGGVITGTIVDGRGQPMPDVQISVMAYIYVRGERQLGMRSTGRTDDRGIYRVYGLRPGKYYVMASPPRVSFMAGGELLAPAEGDIDRALREIATAKASGPPVGGVGRPVGYASTYYPGVVGSRDAVAVELAAGQERSGIDLQLQLVAHGRVEGTITASEPMSPTQVMLTPASEGPASGLEGLRTTTAPANGTFQFASVPPGEYFVTARANRAGGGPETGLGAGMLVTVTADTTTPVALELHTGFTIRGRVIFDGDAMPTGTLRSWRIAVAPTQARGTFLLGAGYGEIQPDGTFAIPGVMPGSFRLVATPPPAFADTWLPRAATVNDREVLEGSFDLFGDIDGVTVTYTNRVAQLSGKLQDASGAPVSDYHVIVYPKDARLWTPHSTRIQAVRPSTDGSYLVKRLAPGDYLVAAVIDVEPGEWIDPAFLQRLTPASLPVTLAEGEQKVQDLKLAGR